MAQTSKMTDDANSQQPARSPLVAHLKIE